MHEVVAGTWRFREADLHNSDHGCVAVVCFCLLSVENFHGKGSTGDGEDRRLEEITGELNSIQCGRGHNQLDVRTFLDSLKSI